MAACHPVDVGAVRKLLIGFMNDCFQYAIWGHGGMGVWMHEHECMWVHNVDQVPCLAAAAEQMRDGGRREGLLLIFR